MTTILCPDDAVALHSETAENWFDPQAPDQSRPLTWEPDEAVTKIVIGTPPSGDDIQEISVSLPENLADLYPNLTHLHLWQIGNLEQLPELPSGLQCLDLRGCKQLVSLPTLPLGLEELDLGGCAALAELPDATPALHRFCVNDCSALEEDLLSVFWRSLGRCQPDAVLIEFDGSRCPAVSSIKRVPRSVERLVLQGCGNLCDVAELGEFTKLRHLNLSACPILREIVSIPDHLQYVQLHGSERLDRFMGQDIGPYDRGTEDRPNVAKTLYSRRKFGGELTASAHAKLLLLGDGRVGKTTLAKRLQWDCLSPQQQADPQFQQLRPKEHEQFTHKVRFGLWKTRLRFDENAAAALNERAQSAGLARPCDEDHRLDGAIRIWDFGGQEIYHQTHRLFAAEGSVFLILWMENPVDPVKLRAEKPRHGVDDEEWEEWNRKRSLDYWLDYVRNIRPQASVPPRIALVCTQVSAGQPHPPWTTSAPKHCDEDLPCFYIDSLEDACPQNPEYRKLVDFIRRACGAEANRIGIVQPSYYSEVAAYVDGLLAENEAARDDDDPLKRPEHLLVPQTVWNENLIGFHAQTGRSQHQLDADDVATITGYLHDAGHIFHLRDTSSPAVLIDQEWATDLIYKLLDPPTHEKDFSLFSVIRANGGYFDLSVLEEDHQWRSLSSEVERQQILSFMEQCGIIVRLLNRDDSRHHKDRYLATEKWLLPEFSGELQHRCEALFGQVLQKSGGSLIEHFWFDQYQINEFEFRSLMAHLGSVLGTRGSWFRNGMQALDDRQQATWCFEVRWRATDEAGFLGFAEARLTAPRQHLTELAQQVEEVFAADGSPFAKQMKRLRRETRVPDELAHIYFRDVTDNDFDVAVSSSGSDRTIVKPLVEALQADGLRVAWYQLPECRAGENVKVMKFMEELRNPPCILLFLSDGYLRNDPENNWYCAWELADALLRLKARARSVRQTLVAYAPGGKLTSMNVDRTAADVLKSMAEYFRDLFHDLVGQDRSNRKTFEYYWDWSNHFDDAADYMGDFFRERGTLGTYSQYRQRNDGSFDFSEVVRDVRQALETDKHRPTD